MPALPSDPAELPAMALRVAGFLVRNAIAEWPFYAIMLSALGIGIGVDARQRRLRRYLSRGFRTDLLYAAVELSHVLQFLFLIGFTSGLNQLLRDYAPWLRLDLGLPAWLDFGLLFLFWDFSAYWYHRAQHAHRYLWQFHKVHHAQVELSALSNFRVPLLDRTVSLTVLSVPSFMMGGFTAMPFALILLIQLHQLLVHVDVAWTPRWLDRLIVMPAFHVTHHSTAPHHCNRNFGSILAIWDHLFGTAVPRGSGPLVFGLVNETLPESYVRQIFVPAVGLCTELFQDARRLRSKLAATASLLPASR